MRSRLHRLLDDSRAQRVLLFLFLMGLIRSNTRVGSMTMEKSEMGRLDPISSEDLVRPLNDGTKESTQVPPLGRSTDRMQSPLAINVSGPFSASSYGPACLMMSFMIGCRRSHV